MNNTVNCQVYRASRQEEMYVYLREGLEPDSLPQELLELVKELTPVMGLELSPERKLARVDVETVIKNINDNGYHLQMPPDPLTPELHHGD